MNYKDALSENSLLRVEGGLFFSHSLRDIYARYFKYHIGHYSDCDFRSGALFAASKIDKNAGSIVTKGVAPYSIAAKKLSKLIQYRYSEAGMELLNTSEWRRYPPLTLIKSKFPSGEGASAALIKQWLEGLNP